MTERPTRAVIRLQLAALALAVGFAAWRSGSANWDAAPLAVLLILSIVSDVAAVYSAAGRIKASGSFLAIVVAVALVGETPAMLIALVTIAASWFSSRYAATSLLNNLVTYAWFPLLAGTLFTTAKNSLGIGPDNVECYLLVIGLFALALALNSISIAFYSAYLEGSSVRSKLVRMLIPVLPSEMASAALAIGIIFAYHQAGISTIALFGIVLLIFQYLLGALLVSQNRADELELRNRQLAGFQVALLSALLRTLDLRDRMTARHSAAVARYAREIAAEAGLSGSDQDLAHTAGLLHDIGKFVLPDEILKSRTPLTPAEWDLVRRHPDEGARIVSQIDGYAPISEVIVAHHERVDGLGYPRGLAGEEIPLIARVVAVADAYDAMTARDSYKRTMSSFEAIAELRRLSGEQFDGRFVAALVTVLAGKDADYRSGEDADFDTELAIDQRIQEFVEAGPAAAGAEPARLG